MRVVVLPSWYPSYLDDPGGIFFREQAFALARAGLKVEVIAPRRHSVRRLFRRESPLVVDHNLTESRCSYLGVPRVDRADHWLWRRVASSLYSDYLRRNGPPDILHAHSLYPAGMFAVHLPAGARILTEHLSTLLGPQGPELALRASSAMRSFEVRIAVGQHLADTMERLAPDGGKWIHLPNMVDTEFFKPTRFRPERLRVLTISNLTRRKRIDWIIRAFDSAACNTNAELHIAGDGEDRSRLERLASQLNSAPRIRFMGSLSRARVREQLDQCSFLALASAHEPFGVVLLEAMAMGRPVLATACGGPAAIVTDRTGILTNVSEFSDFAIGMQCLIDRLGEYSSDTVRELCIERFGERAVTSRLIAVYSGALRRGQAAC